MNQQSKEKNYFLPDNILSILQSIINQYNSNKDNKDNIGYNTAINILNNKYVSGHLLKKIIYNYKYRPDFLNVFGNSELRNWFFKKMKHISKVEENEIDAKKKLNLPIRKKPINENKNIIIFILKNEI